ncbi:hypothetical protein [Tabrizicola fusiformis]|uniref:hypothetical protein n=1 Tax=Tabrizicola sp. SY72 TaxID=2741673 RepID=UPI0015719BCA|nr:hypothetical protein [Tabrizicola sp. SY72]NTT88360.1 hypothetical protein [Tabrizicola sp. SY72]
MTPPAAQFAARQTILRFLAAMAAGNLVWEIGHLPLYTLWVTGSPGEIAYAVLHCTVGDVMIGGICLLLSLALLDRKAWPHARFGAVAGATILFALGYTVFSEWLNTEVRESWTYREAMPRLPILGTGLTPVLQWIVVPVLAFRWSLPRTVKQ